MAQQVLTQDERWVLASMPSVPTTVSLLGDALLLSDDRVLRALHGLQDEGLVRLVQGTMWMRAKPLNGDVSEHMAERTA